MSQKTTALFFCFLQNFWQKPAWGHFTSSLAGIRVKEAMVSVGRVRTADATRK